jgi:hypothetical protein
VLALKESVDKMGAKWSYKKEEMDEISMFEVARTVLLDNHVKDPVYIEHQ